VDGVLATHLVFPEMKVVKFPNHLSYAEASTLPCAGLTAYNALGFNEGSITGKTVLIQGALPVLLCIVPANTNRDWWCKHFGY
jgi:NADPH:quinone reductase-like Zn-dependent oxidoreductase